MTLEFVSINSVLRRIAEWHFIPNAKIVNNADNNERRNVSCQAEPNRCTVLLLDVCDRAVARTSRILLF